MFQSPTPFICDKCGESREYRNHSFVCTKCGYTTIVEPTETRCISCGKKYTEYTWFDPSGCQYCGKSFVE